MSLTDFFFLLDLDETLVATDNIYIEVWKDILKSYSIEINDDFFYYFIKGKSDIDFLSYLLPNITSEDIKYISKQKDEKFLDLLKDKDILIDGVLSFFEKIKDCKIAIVTSSNRVAAEQILKLTGIDKYIDCLIASEDCKKHKPNCEPYLNAINMLDADKNKCIIFEDSYTGYISAKNANVYKVCIYYSKFHEEIENLVEYKFSSYLNLNLDNIICDPYTVKDTNIKCIWNALESYPIKDITKSDTIIKTGYICDIYLYKVYLNNDLGNIDVILKINGLNNALSNVAEKLGMYKNEAVFYNNISKYLNVINVPHCYGITNNKNVYGILMENLSNNAGTFNIDLNTNINVLLNVVNSISKLHNMYKFNNDNDVIASMKSLFKINEISYYKELVHNRFSIFLNNSEKFMSSYMINIFCKIKNNYDKILDNLSKFPLSFCHGDLKSPNIFYKNYTEPYFLDWQYIHLNKGVSDIVFLLVESINFNKDIINIVEKYYYRLLVESKDKCTYEEYIFDFKLSLCSFAFFVCVWFNSENSEDLLDKTFPIKFMKNLIKYYEYYLDDDFFSKLDN